MTQLIISGNYMPEIEKNRYSCSMDLLGDTVTMISGRIVREIRGSVCRISASYQYIDTNLLRNVLGVFRSGKSFVVTYLPDDSDEMQTGMFMVETLTNPTFSFSAAGAAYWTGLAFTLREVTPHA